MSNPSTVITSFVLESLPAQTVARRIELTRAAAALVANDDDRRELTSIANGLERLERRQRKLTLRFKGGRRA